MAKWKVVRYVRETIWIKDAATRQEALDMAENPHSVEVTRETAVRVKPETPKIGEEPA